MPILSNARHERFAQELAKGKSADEAYQLAGYCENRGNATRLKANENVLKRVAELQSRAAERTIISRQRTLEELAAIAYAPLGTPHVKTSDKRAALADLAKLEGWMVDRSEVGKPGDFSELSAQQLRDEIVRDAAALGLTFESLAEEEATSRPNRRGRLN